MSSTRISTIFGTRLLGVASTANKESINKHAVTPTSMNVAILCSNRRGKQGQWLVARASAAFIGIPPAMGRLSGQWVSSGTAGFSIDGWVPWVNFLRGRFLKREHQQGASRQHGRVAEQSVHVLRQASGWHVKEGPRPEVAGSSHVVAQSWKRTTGVDRPRASGENRKPRNYGQCRALNLTTPILSPGWAKCVRSNSFPSD